MKIKTVTKSQVKQRKPVRSKHGPRARTDGSPKTAGTPVAQEEVLSTTYHQGNANQNPSEMPPHTQFSALTSPGQRVGEQKPWALLS